MKRLLLTMLLFASALAQAQWWTGWSQKTGLALCIHLADSAVQLYSPLQTSAPLAVSKWSLDGDTLRIECKSIGFRSTLVRDGDGWRGNWRQGLMREDIVFALADTLYSLSRPQEPKPPYGFDEETVVADYTDSQGNAVHLEGTLACPRGSGRYPCLLLVSGSGQQNRDEELMQHKPFLVLADYLASQGIATLRYDDRGVGASTGPLDSADTYLFAEDAEAMFRAVQGNSRVDAKRLGIGGHSEGGAIAPLVAARNSDVGFVVMLAGQGCTGREVMVQQNGALLAAQGVSDSLCAVRMRCMAELFDLPASATVKDCKAVIERHLKPLDKAQADSLGLKKGDAYQLHQQLQNRWMRAFLALDPASYLPRVNCPVLALCGTKDCQVPAVPNLQRIGQLCPQARCQALEGLNHLFQHCQTGAPSEYVQIAETFAPEAMKAVADFINRLQ